MQQKLSNLRQHSSSLKLDQILDSKVITWQSNRTHATQSKTSQDANALLKTQSKTCHKSHPRQTRYKDGLMGLIPVLLNHHERQTRTPCESHKRLMAQHGMALLLTIEFSVISAASRAAVLVCDQHAKNERFMAPKAAALGPGSLSNSLDTTSQNPENP